MNIKKIGFAFFTFVSIGVFTLFSGCVKEGPNSSTELPVATGYVYLDDHVIGGATVEAISADGIDHQSNITNDRGAYVLNITPNKIYNITAIYQGFRHTVWPVYLSNKTDTYNINLTTTSRSTIEGIGHAYREGKPFPIDHMTPPVITLVPTSKNHTTISTYFGKDGSYSIEVDPNVQYAISSKASFEGHFYYRNQPIELYVDEITVGSNETALIDVGYYLP